MSSLAAAVADMGFGLTPLPREDTPTGAALAAAAADMGFGLVPREGMPSGAGSSPTLRGTPLCAMVDTDGVLRATNNLPIECHICAENHFKSDCPKLDTAPCFHCRGGSRSARLPYGAARVAAQAALVDVGAHALR